MERKNYLPIIALALLGALPCIAVLIAIDKETTLTLVEEREITQPDEVSKPYVTSANLRSYARGQDWADIAILQATSPTMLGELVEYTTDLAEGQGFALAGEESGAQVYVRTWDPLLQQATSEYIEILVVNQKIIMARGTNLDLVHQLVQQAAEDVR